MCRPEVKIKCLPPLLSLLIFETDSLVINMDLASKAPVTLVSVSPKLGFTCVPLFLAFYKGSRGQNSALPVYIASTLPTKLVPKPLCETSEDFKEQSMLPAAPVPRVVLI